ncbi:MAG TPA: hypothetical protein VLX92_20165, partial [Kofleriaceae bacterium]|nr:hypothetical protein [Kofleriaceae bacterium]
GDADLAQLTYMVDRISAPPGGAARSGSRVYFATGERDLEKMIAADAKAAIEASRTSLQRPDRR